MTAPDGDRLPATNSGQETQEFANNPHDCPHGSWSQDGPFWWRCQLCGTNQPAGLHAPQQPPAQEQWDDQCAHGYLRWHGCRHCWPPAPPSEADSAGEVEGNDGLDELLSYINTRTTLSYLFEYAIARGLLDCAGPDERWARRLLARHYRAMATAVNVTDWPAYIRLCADTQEDGTAWFDRRMLAASPGVQGGDGEARAATNPAVGLERASDGATSVGARERLAAVLADDNQLNLGIAIGVHHSKRVEFWDRVAEIAVRAAGGPR